MDASTTGWLALLFLFDELLFEKDFDPPELSKKFLPDVDFGLVEEVLGS